MKKSAQKTAQALSSDIMEISKEPNFAVINLRLNLDDGIM